MVIKERCRRDAHFFIFDSKILRTKDEHDPKNPMKNLPDVPYLRCLLDLLLVSGKIIKPEEARYLRLHGYVDNPQLIDDLYESGVCMADKSRQIMATWAMEVGLPDWLQNHRNGTYAHLTFETGSHVWAIPEGGNIVRSNTPSVLFSDEAAFQPEFGSAYSAAMPAVEGLGSEAQT